MGARAGIIYIKVNGIQYDAKGEFTYNIGSDKRSGIAGTDGKNHGYKTETTIPFIEGKITDGSNVSLVDFTNIEDATVTLELANGKVITLKDAYYAADGNVSTEEGEIDLRFEGIDCDEIG